MGNKRIEKKKARMREIRAIQKVLSEKDTKKPSIDQKKKQEEVISSAEVKETSTSSSSAKKTGTKALKPFVYLQFEGIQVERTELFNAVKQWWKEQGYMIKDLKDMDLYVKPEEKMLYFTINHSVQGSIPIPFLA